jgi:hypothetical protein
VPAIEPLVDCAYPTPLTSRDTVRRNVVLDLTPFSIEELPLRTLNRVRECETWLPGFREKSMAGVSHCVNSNSVTLKRMFRYIRCKQQ